MENYLSIGEVSRLLNIPEHTLRYWQDAGIFSVRQEMNNYRKYTMADLLNIAEVAFYRNIGIPVKQMERFNRFGLEDYSQILDDVKLRVERQMEELRAMHQLKSAFSGRGTIPGKTFHSALLSVSPTAIRIS